MKKILILLLSLVNRTTNGQAIDNPASFRDDEEIKYFRIHYDNDFFAAADFYYTQGINLELVTPSLNKFPLNFLLIHPKKRNNRFGISLEHNSYTPASIRKSEIQRGDHPYASLLVLKWFCISENLEKKSRLSSAMTLGIIGPVVFGGDIQTYIHKITDNPLPQGWHNQIQNYLLINYEINHEYFLVNGR